MPVPVRQVALPEVPIPLLRRSEEEVQSVLEAAEQAVTAQGDALTSSLALVVRALTEEYKDISDGMWAEIEAAEAAGKDRVDLTIEGPVTLASAAETWLRLLEHLDDLRKTGQFDHPATPDEVRTFRQWLVSEIAEQMREGRAPTPFVRA